MNRAICFVLVVVLLAFVVSAAHAAGRTTLDPNTVRKVITPLPPIGAADARLDAKITYDASGVRLHDVISEIARVTGATIYCGSTPEDWRARDMPVTVAARGIPARKLLDFVTYATQTSFIEVKTENRKFYRVVLNAKLKKKCDDYQTAVDNFDKAQALWTLGLACRLKDIPLSTIKAPNGVREGWSDRLASAIEVSRLLSAMDVNTRNAVVSGEKLIFSPRTAPASLRLPLLDVLRSMDQARVNEFRRYSMIRAPATPDQLDDSLLGVESIGGTIWIIGVYRFGDNEWHTSREHTSAMADTVLTNMDPSMLPKQPTSPSLPVMDRLSGSKEMGNTPEAAKKVTIKLDADDKPKFGGDALIALSKALDLTIVCEDFETVHKERDVAASFGKESTVAEALEAAVNAARWSAHSESRALIGVNSNWMQELRNLIPQLLVDDLTAKADGDGVDLDDLTALLGFPAEGLQKWLRGEKLQGLPFQVFVESDTKPIWSFYSSLSPSEKELAKRGAGLPLSRYDPTFIAGMLKDYMNAYCVQLLTMGARGTTSKITSPSPFPRLDEVARNRQMLDDAVLSTLVMHVKATEYEVSPNPSPSVAKDKADEKNTESVTPEKIPAGFTKPRDYYILIEGGDAANRISLRIDGPRRLPFFSPKRTAELSQALASQNAAAARPAKN